MIGDELWASTIDHIYVIDTTTIGEEQIVADIPTNGLWDPGPPIDLEIFGRWCIPGRCIPGREPVEPTAIVKIDSRSRTATGMIELDGVSGFGSSLVVADDAIYIRTEGKVIELRRGEEAADQSTSAECRDFITVHRGCHGGPIDGLWLDSTGRFPVARSPSPGRELDLRRGVGGRFTNRGCNGRQSGWRGAVASICLRL